MTEIAPFQGIANFPNVATGSTGLPSTWELVRRNFMSSLSDLPVVSSVIAHFSADSTIQNSEPHLKAEEVTLTKRAASLLRRLTDQDTSAGVVASTPVGLKVAPAHLHPTLTEAFDSRPTQAIALIAAGKIASQAIAAANNGDVEAAIVDGGASAVTVASSSPVTRAATAKAVKTIAARLAPDAVAVAEPVLKTLRMTLGASPGWTGFAISSAFAVAEEGVLISDGASLQVISASAACGASEVAANTAYGTIGAEAARTACVKFFGDRGIPVRPGFIQEAFQDSSGFIKPIELTAEQRKFYEYFDKIPDGDTSDPALNELITLKREIIAAQTEATNNRSVPMATSENNFLAAGTAAETRLTAAEEAFSTRYETLSTSGKLPALSPITSASAIATPPSSAPLTPPVARNGNYRS